MTHQGEQVQQFTELFKSKIKVLRKSKLKWHRFQNHQTWIFT